MLDVTPPEVSNCPEDRTSEVPFGTQSLVVTWIEPTATDDSGETPRVTSTRQPGDTFPVGVSRVTYTYTDGSGNQAACVFTVTIGKICSYYSHFMFI